MGDSKGLNQNPPCLHKKGERYMSKKFDMFVNKFFDGIEKVFSFFNAIMVTVMVAVVVFDVFSTLFKYPIAITTELTGLTFAWITGFSGVLIAMRDENISLTIIKDKFSGASRLVVDTLIDLACIAFSYIMFRASWEMCLSMKTLYMPLFRFPKTVLYAAMLLMFGLITVTMILRVIQRLLKKWEERV